MNQKRVDPQSNRVLRTLLGGGTLMIHKALIDICDGSHNAALMLSRACFWSEYHKDEHDGWFFQTIEQWYDDTRLRRKQQMNARDILDGLGVWETILKGSPPKNYFRVNFDRIWELIAALEQAPLGTIDDRKEPLDGAERVPIIRKESSDLSSDIETEEKNQTQTPTEEETQKQPQHQPQPQQQEQPQHQVQTHTPPGVDLDRQRAEYAEKDRVREAKAFKRKHPGWKLPAHLRPPEDEDDAGSARVPLMVSRPSPVVRESAIEARSRRNREAINAAFGPDDGVGACLLRYSLSLSADIIPETAETWFEFIGDRDPDHVSKAFQVCMKGGGTFLPRPNEVLAEVERIEAAGKPQETLKEFFAKQESKRKSRPR